MPDNKILITGASGEIGQALIQSLSNNYQREIVSVDLKPLPAELAGKSTHILGNLLDINTIESLENKNHFSHIFHLAAVLSTTAEYNPLLGHQVNTCATVDLLEMASRQSQKGKESVKFIFPSSIAVYGLPDLNTKNTVPPVKENQWTEPTTMYGCSKLYCEKVGVYYSEYFQQLADQTPVRLDFRAIRFPGIISAFTIPSGGTSDFGPEMIHAAAQGKPYDSFVRSDVRIPFMMMPDAVRSLLMLAEAPGEKLRQRIYNITSFSYSAKDFKELAQSGFPGAKIGFNPDPPRQAIVDSWPADIDDSAARADWGWYPLYESQTACHEYLIENIAKHYS
ncbi:MAG: NAD-dependent epimerase/dehydratase family protein [Anaerolineales bacterium]|nr:MAG: NAD-dependent epimerase/dehydratase family protein [Anaerolineales bacterium]